MGHYMTLNAYRDADFLRNYRFPSSFDLTGYTARGVIYDAIGGNTLLEVTASGTENGSSTIVGDGVITWTVNAADIADLPEAANSEDASILFFDMFVTSSSSAVSKIHGGVFRVWPLGGAIRGADFSTDINVSVDGDDIDIDMDASSVENLPTAAFPGAVRRTVTDRLRADDIDLADIPRPVGMTDLQWINTGILTAAVISESISTPAVPADPPLTGQPAVIRRCRLRLGVRELNIGPSPILIASGVDLDLTGTTIIHTRASNTSGSVTALSGTGLGNFSVTGGKWVGPASWIYNNVLRRSEAYAFRLTACSDFEFDTYYEDGNAGLQLAQCTRLKAKLHSLNMNGANIKLIGGSFMDLWSDTTNCCGFGIKCEAGVNNVTVHYTRKRVDETLLDPDKHQGIIREPSGLEPVYKRSPFRVNASPGITWSASNGGELTIPVTRDPTVATTVNPWAPAVLPEGDVEVFRVANNEDGSTNTLNAVYKAKSVTSSTIVCYCPVQPTNTYTSSGYVGDLRYKINVLGEEAIACSVPSFKFRILEIYAHRIGDAGSSIMGNDIYVDVIEARECRLSAIQSSGKGNHVNKIISYNNGMYSTDTFTYGGFGMSFVSSAGNYSENSSVGKINSTDDIGGGLRLVFASTDKAFEPDGVCESLYMSVPSLTGTPNEYWIFGCRPGPLFFGPDSVPGQGLASGVLPAFPNGIPPFTAAPTDEEVAAGAEPYFWDGLNAWRYTATFVGNAAPIAPTNCRVAQIFMNGPGVFVQDQIGYGYGNTYPYQYEMNDAPYPVLLNADFEYWPAGTGAINLSNTARCEGAEGGNPAGTSGNLGVWFGGRPEGSDVTSNAAMSRITGQKALYAVKLHRLPDTDANGAIYFGTTITDPEKLRDLLGKKLKLTFQAWYGSQWSDQNLSLSWSMYSRTSYLPLDGDLNPQSVANFSTGTARVYDTSRPIEILSTAVVPDTCKQLIIRISWNPNVGVANRIAMMGRGSGYTSVPTVSFTGGGSHGSKVLPTARANVSGGKVSSITLLTNGSNLEAAPTVVLTGGNPTVAAGAVCVVPLKSDTEDWLAIERPCLGPADKTSLWKREALDVTVARLTHNTYLIENP